MIVFKTARSLFKILNAELTPTQIAVGFCFGIAAGLAPLGVHTYFLFSIALLFHCSFSGALLFFPVFKLLEQPLAPISYNLGRSILDGLFLLDPILNNVFHWPILALLDYHHYLIFGDYVMAFLLSIPAFFMVKKTVESYRDRWLMRWESKLEATQSYRALRKRDWLYRSLIWTVGGRVYFRENAPPQRFFFRVLRKESLWVLPSVYLVTLLLLALVIPFTISQIVASAATYLIGGEVTTHSVSFNSFNGRLMVPQLIVQNPAQKEENAVVLSDLVLDIDLPALLAKRLVINEASVAEISFNIRRQADGSLNLSHLDTGQNFSQYFAWLAREAANVDWLKLTKEYLKARFEAPHKHELEPYAGARDLPGFAPTFVLEKLKIGRIHLTLMDETRPQSQLPALSMVDIFVDDLSWNPALSSTPIKVTLTATLSGMPDGVITWVGVFEEKRAHREFTVEFKKIDIAAFNSLYEKSIPVKVSRGLVSMTSRTVVDGSRAHGKANLLIEDLHLGALADFSLFGLDQDVSLAVLKGINSYADRCPILLEFPVSGTWEAPRFELEGPLLEIAKQGLIWAGQSNLLADPLSQIDQKLQELQILSSKLLPLPSGANPLESIFNQLLQQSDLQKSQCGKRKSLP